MTYQGPPGGPRDPATPGPYCLRRCYCGCCPQYQQQTTATAVLREQEYAARDRHEGQRQTRHSPRRPDPQEDTR